MKLRLPAAAVLAALGMCGAALAQPARYYGNVPFSVDLPKPTAPAVDWALTFDPASTAGTLAPSLLGQYDLSGELFHYDQVPQLPPLMKAAGFAEWRVGLGRWEFFTLLLPTLTDGSSCSPGLGILNHDGSPKPAYYAYTLLAAVIGSGSSRLAPTGNADGRLDGRMGAVLASRDAAGKIRVLLINRGAVARTATVGATPTAVTVFDDPTRQPHAVSPSDVVTVPARSLVLVERPGAGDLPDLVPRQRVIRPRPRAHGKESDAQIVFEAPGIPGDGNVQEIFTMNLDGSNRTQITHGGLNKFLPHFSPDGTRLVYTKFLVGGYGDPNARTDVVVYDFASAKETQLTSTGTSSQPVWSPDGQRIAFGSNGDSLRIMNADGSNDHLVGAPSGALYDKIWGDIAWSSDDWILFVVAQFTNNCFKTRLDKIRPDGTARTQVTDGGPNCTPSGMEQSGDADPGFSADGKTIYSSRGFPRAPAGMPTRTERRLYSFSSDAWTPGKVETDLSLPSAPDCIEGVPKGSPDDTRVLLFRACAGEPHSGVTLTDKAGSYRTWIADGFGPDWNPVAMGRTTPTPNVCIDTVVSGNNDLSHVKGGVIAFTLQDTAGQLQIFTAKPDGSELRQLTSEGQNGLADWSPDGKQLTFMAIRAGAYFIGVMNADGWSGIENKYGQVWSMHADGTASTQLTHETQHSNNDDPSWSPDGTKILFSTGRSGRNELWVMDADGSNEMRLFPIDAAPFPGRGAWQPIP